MSADKEIEVITYRQRTTDEGRDPTSTEPYQEYERVGEHSVKFESKTETPNIIIVGDDTEARRKVIEGLGNSDPGKKILIVDDYSQIPDRLKSKVFPETTDNKLVSGYKAVSRNGGIGVVTKKPRPKIEGLSLRDMFIP